MENSDKTNFVSCDTFCDLPRHVPANPHNYTVLQLAERTKALKDLERDYPNVPFGWLELVYDWEKNTDVEEVEDIINTGRWEGNGRPHPKCDKPEDDTNSNE